MSAFLPHRLRMALSWLPSMPPALLARRLMRQASAARDARRWQAASVLYAEALRLAPGNGRLHIQCGHMLKEAGDFTAAEAAYRAAEALLPDDAELALQFGHFFKVAGRLDEAEAAYRKATVLQPGWAEAADELARIRGSFDADDTISEPTGLAPELLPSDARVTNGPPREGIHVVRLGAARMRGAGGFQRVLRGVEAIRGYCVSIIPIHALELRLDGATLARAPLEHHPIDGTDAARYVFNLWHDFTGAPRGPARIELRFHDARGRTRTHRATLMITDPLSVGDAERSDAFVPAPSGAGALEDRINALPSMIRPARRGLLPAPPRSILVLRVDQLGDLVVSVPALRRLRALFPDARITGLVTPANAPFARTLGLFDTVLEVRFDADPRDGRRTMPRAEQEALRRRLAPHAFDIAIDLGENDASRPLLVLSGAPFLYGFKVRELPWLSAGMEIAALDPVDRLETIAHSRKLVALVDGLAAILESDARVLRRDDLDPAPLAPYGIAPNDRYALLHTGARLAYSRWPHFSALARLLLERTELKLIVMSDAPEPFDVGPHDPDRLTFLSGRLPFDTFDALLSFAAVMVGNDSGPKHLAALRGTPVVSLHMARLNWNEWGQEIGGSIVSRRVPCAGCGIGADGSECGKAFACLRHIRPEEVLAAIRSAMDATPTA